ncbi:MAG: lasso peptide biosynthesis B2 protein [Parasphingorhabdus sp.]|uniref:lasso peptide biosynthesis B2 protein n=1 Tax=Parasphingorhabdus sp. TaxID=2709688 RepID=UPI0032642D33
MHVSRITILQYILMVPLTEIGIRVWGLKMTWRMLNAIALPASRQLEAAETEVKSHLSGLKRARRIMPIKGKCLARSLVFWWQLERRGLHATLNIGVRKKKMFRAHAWLEYEGLVLNADQQVREKYKSIAEFHQPKDMT